MKRPNVILTSTLGLHLLVAMVLGVAAQAQDTPAYRLPLFRTVNPAAKPPALPAETRLLLLADADFAPFSFAATTGEAAGLAVDLALAACAELKAACEVRLLPFGELLPALAKGDGDVIVSGPLIDDKALANGMMTRPYFRTLARFAVQSGSPLTASDALSLAGKRIGVVKGTAHAAWLEFYYRESEILPFGSEAEAQEALRTGNSDALFGDGLRMIYWVEGANSRGCCKLLDGAYVDRDYFSRSVAFLVRGQAPELRDAFDYALDRLQANGTTEKIFIRYVPLNPW